MWIKSVRYCLVLPVRDAQTCRNRHRQWLINMAEHSSSFLNATTPSTHPATLMKQLFLLCVRLYAKPISICICTFSLLIVCDNDAFVSYYCVTMESTFIPKLHMLEDHVLPFIRQWRVGLGMLGEQGVEGIHA